MYEIFEIKKKVTCFFSFEPSDILWRKFSKAKMPGTSYQSLELHNMLTKIPFLVLPFKSGSCGKRKKKNNKRLNKLREKTFSKFFEMLSFGKIEDTSFKFEYSDSY